jgi:hypothetical protein
VRLRDAPEGVLRREERAASMRGPRGLPRRVPRRLVPGPVDRDAALLGHLFGQREWKAVGLPEVEGHVAGEFVALEPAQKLGDAEDATLERPQKLRLLGL